MSWCIVDDLSTDVDDNRCCIIWNMHYFGKCTQLAIKNVSAMIRNLPLYCHYLLILCLYRKNRNVFLLQLINSVY